MTIAEDKKNSHIFCYSLKTPSHKAEHRSVVYIASAQRSTVNDEDAASDRHTCLTSLRNRAQQARLVAYVHTNNDVDRPACVFT